MTLPLKRETTTPDRAPTALRDALEHRVAVGDVKIARRVLVRGLDLERRGSSSSGPDSSVGQLWLGRSSSSVGLGLLGHLSARRCADSRSPARSPSRPSSRRSSLLGPVGTSSARAAAGPVVEDVLARRARCRGCSSGRAPSVGGRRSSVARSEAASRRGRFSLVTRRVVGGRAHSGSSGSTSSRRVALVVELRDRVARASRASPRGSARSRRFGSTSMRHLLDHREPEPVEAGQLARVVREDPDRRQTEVGQDLVADPPLARVGREAELEVRLDRVEAVLLELVRRSLLRRPIPRPSWPM